MLLLAWSEKGGGCAGYTWVPAVTPDMSMLLFLAMRAHTHSLKVSSPSLSL